MALVETLMLSILCLRTLYCKTCCKTTRATMCRKLSALCSIEGTRVRRACSVSPVMLSDSLCQSHSHHHHLTSAGSQDGSSDDDCVATYQATNSSCMTVNP